MLKVINKMLEHTLNLLVDIINPLLKDYPEVANSLINHIKFLITANKKNNND